MTTAILEGMAQKRPKELWGKRGAHEAHNKTEELPRKTLNETLLHSAPFYSLAETCYVLLTEVVFGK